jgi:hypothetical protein
MNQTVDTTGAMAPPVEPTLAADDIQGNFIPGFMKPFMALVVM